MELQWNQVFLLFNNMMIKLLKQMRDKNIYIDTYRMRLSLLLFILGLICITSGYVNQMDPQCKGGTEVRIVPRNVFDQIIKDSTL